MLYEIRKIANNEMQSTGLEKHMVDYLITEKKWDKKKSYIIGYLDESYKTTGIIEAVSEFCGTCDIINLCIDPGYGYDHVIMFQLQFEDKEYGLCIFDTRSKQFIEEPGSYEDYSVTVQDVERKYNFKSIAI